MKVSFPFFTGLFIFFCNSSKTIYNYIGVATGWYIFSVGVVGQNLQEKLISASSMPYLAHCIRLNVYKPPTIRRSYFLISFTSLFNVYLSTPKLLLLTLHRFFFYICCLNSFFHTSFVIENSRNICFETFETVSNDKLEQLRHKPLHIILQANFSLIIWFLHMKKINTLILLNPQRLINFGEDHAAVRKKYITGT